MFKILRKYWWNDKKNWNFINSKILGKTWRNFEGFVRFKKIFKNCGQC